MCNQSKVINLKLKEIESDRNILNKIIGDKNQQDYIPNPPYQKADSESLFGNHLEKAALILNSLFRGEKRKRDVKKQMTLSLMPLFY